ncbi:hypothetical protein M569_03719, partial [Genlisea aurea]
TMQWAATRNHIGGIPRKMIFMAVGAFAKAVVNLFNNTNVYNLETLLRLVCHRPPGVPLITVSNHMSTLDDPLLWGVKDFPITDSNLGRWVLAAEDICFRSPVLSYFFRLGKCIPIRRGGGIYQEHMNEAVQRLTDGDWVHAFPEGKVCQEDAPIRRLKWGTASLIARAPVTPIVIPIAHRGFERVMPENYMLGRRPLFPLTGKDISIIIGEPILFDVPKMKHAAVETSRNSSYPSHGWPRTACGLDEAAQVCLYTTISDQIRGTMEKLCHAAKSRVK